MTAINIHLKPGRAVSEAPRKSMRCFIISPLQGFKMYLPGFQGLRPWLACLAPLGLTD